MGVGGGVEGMVGDGGVGVGGGGGWFGTSVNRSELVYMVENLWRLGKIQSRSASEFTPSHCAIPLHTLSQGVVGMKRPRPIQLGWSLLRGVGKSPRIFPPFTLPPIKK